MSQEPIEKWWLPKAPWKVLGSSSTSATNSTPLPSRKAENKYAEGNPVCICPNPKWQKGIGEFFSLSKDSEKENQIPEEARTSGLRKAKRKTCRLQPDPQMMKRTELSYSSLTYILCLL